MPVLSARQGQAPLGRFTYAEGSAPCADGVAPDLRSGAFALPI